jgi:1-acyl-sn-glycerol-3-phosphate acyltransferase
VTTAEVIRIDARARNMGRLRCRATTTSGRSCRNYAREGGDYCAVHERARGSRTARPAAPARNQPDRARDVWEWLRRRLRGEYKVDDFGLDEELLRDVMTPLVRPLYERWFRVQTLGVNRIPGTGPALLVANHSGTIPLDSVMMTYAVANEHSARRLVRNVGADLVYRLPLVGPLARKAGTVVAHEDDALELLRRGELVGVFPEGYKGVGKGWRERYRLQRFGRGGFIELALRARVSIVPVAIVGAEEAYPMIGNIKPLASLLGLPYFPVTPTWPLLGPLGVVPLPSRWFIEFGEPVAMNTYPDDAAEDPMLVFDLTDEIRDRIQQMLFKNLSTRGGSFL